MKCPSELGIIERGADPDGLQLKNQLIWPENWKVLLVWKRAILVDRLTLWLTNLMMAERDIDAEITRLTNTLSHLAGAIVLVSNEVGLGIVPENRMAREFRDHAGRLHQAVAAAAAKVYFVAAGLPLKMKG